MSTKTDITHWFKDSDSSSPYVATWSDSQTSHQTCTQVTEEKKGKKGPSKIVSTVKIISNSYNHIDSLQQNTMTMHAFSPSLIQDVTALYRSLITSWVAFHHTFTFDKTLVNSIQFNSIFICPHKWKICLGFTSNLKLTKTFNPILTGGSIWPPPPPPPAARNPRLPRDRRRSRHTFSWLFSFKSYASFDTKFAKIGPSVARSCDILYSHVGTKFAQNPHFAYMFVYKTHGNYWFS